MITFINNIPHIYFIEPGVHEGNANSALAGLSMGGVQTLYAGIKNTDLFAYLGVFTACSILGSAF